MRSLEGIGNLPAAVSHAMTYREDDLIRSLSSPASRKPSALMSSPSKASLTTRCLGWLSCPLSLRISSRMQISEVPSVVKYSQICSSRATDGGIVQVAQDVVVEKGFNVRQVYIVWVGAVFPAVDEKLSTSLGV